VIIAYLDDVDLEIDAARRLVADPPNRFAAFHLQQASEKLVKAVRLVDIDRVATRGLRKAIAIFIRDRSLCIACAGIGAALGRSSRPSGLSS
jgi:hypothetical protein